MLQDRIAKRYAKSIYELAEQHQQLEAVHADMRTLGRMLTASRELRSFLGMPLLNQERKAAILDKVLAEAQAHELTRKYVRAVAERGRAEVLPYISREFVELYNERHNRTPVLIRSAVALSAEQRQAIVAKVEAGLKTTVLVEETVDPALIGGLTIRIGDRLFDGSVATALHTIDKKFTDNPYLEKI